MAHGLFDASYWWKQKYLLTDERRCMKQYRGNGLTSFDADGFSLGSSNMDGLIMDTGDCFT